MLHFKGLIQIPEVSTFAIKMNEYEVIKDLILAVAQAIILFGPTADCRHEYSAADIAKTLNPAMESRRRPIVVYVADLEDGFRESTIQKSVVKCFPMQIEMNWKMMRV